MRAKHIFLPIAAIALLGSYAVYTGVQKAKFDSDIWKEALHEDVNGVREEMLSPLMVHVLKFGMTLEEVDDLLGWPDEERTGGASLEIGAPQLSRVYKIKISEQKSQNLILDFSYTMKLINFYIEGDKAVLF